MYKYTAFIHILYKGMYVFANEYEFQLEDNQLLGS